jgi:hypothetical protein
VPWIVVSAGEKRCFVDRRSDDALNRAVARQRDGTFDRQTTKPACKRHALAPPRAHYFVHLHTGAFGADHQKLAALDD